MEEPPHICYASVVLLAVTTQASEPLLDGLCSRRHCEGVWLAQKAHQIPDHPLQLANVTQEFPGVKGGAGWGFVKLHKVRVHRIGGSTIAISHLTSGRRIRSVVKLHGLGSDLPGLLLTSVVVAERAVSAVDPHGARPAVATLGLAECKIGGLIQGARGTSSIRPCSGICGGSWSGCALARPTGSRQRAPGRCAGAAAPFRC